MSLDRAYTQDTRGVVVIISIGGGTSNCFLTAAATPADESRASPALRAEGADTKVKPAVVSSHSARASPLLETVLLATAQVGALSSNGEIVRVRALLDQGSEASFVSESAAQLLQLPRRTVEISLRGISGRRAGAAHSAIRLVLSSLVDPRSTVEIDALVLPRLTAPLPACSLKEHASSRFRGLPLADPQFTTSNPVDLILGAEVYGQILKSGVRRWPASRLVAQNTVFGWVVFGAVTADPARRAASASLLHCSTDPDLLKVMEGFWRLEEIPSSLDKWDDEEQSCDELFSRTHSRNSEGRYVVRLPFKSSLPEAARETRGMALGSLRSMHRRFARDARLAQSYREFMETYESLGHMERVPPEETANPSAWYLPHHAVVQCSGTAWKLRVVFDASRQTKGGYSLNHYMMKGPPLQRDLALILLNWRRYRFVFTTDIVKMFRQIGVVPADQDCQRIVWSPDPTVDPVDYRLTTVTYGTNSAPYLAIRTLLQLARDEGSRFPLGARCLENYTYVDDVFAGADDLALAVKKRSELVELLGLAGFPLDKWAANHPSLLPIQPRSVSSTRINDGESVKTLGIYWDSIQDAFRFDSLAPKSTSDSVTKRVILSDISRLFDPLG
ncbi:PREDICTED: uncharacterized protein LOC105570900, partial [Vollenhovia emeryi]|uniref:uncharacterized protein LOC105570900 n=1 Tax=Vollenhovia emeryi TaxID=411798 RepID=UPI0005F52114